MSDDNFDDGLVHAHQWATEKPTVSATGAPSSSAVEGEIDHDDGLVHGHDWASSGR